jgi:DNA-directed RNA polymerase specialized sigma24 family protein
LFNFDPELPAGRNSSTRVVASRMAKQSVEARQRDIYDSHRHRTYSLAYYMTGNEIEAEKILTDTFVRAFRAVPEPSGEDVDSALLEELCQRSHLEWNIETPGATSGTADLSPCLGNGNVKRTCLEEALRDLSPAERLLFLLRDVEGYTSAAMAQLLKLPEVQVQRGVFAARIKLRRILAAAQNQSAQEMAA